MKISDPIVSSGQIQPAAGRTQNRQTKASAATTNADQIHLSGLGSKLSQGVSSQHKANLSGLADAVSAGRYRPDPNAVSASLIQHSLVA